MHDYILLMHNDAAPSPSEPSDELWGLYIESLNAAGVFQGGSSMGSGICVNKAGTQVALSAQLGGFIRIRANDLNHAREFVKGNPVFEAGGTVEIRELPRGTA